MNSCLDLENSWYWLLPNRKSPDKGSCTVVKRTAERIDQFCLCFAPYHLQFSCNLVSCHHLFSKENVFVDHLWELTSFNSLTAEIMALCKDGIFNYLDYHLDIKIDSLVCTLNRDKFWGCCTNLLQFTFRNVEDSEKSALPLPLKKF